MQIDEQKAVTLSYTLKDNEGTLIDESKDGSFVYLHGASNIIPGLENALAGKAKGDTLSVSIAPEEAYGVRDDKRVEKVSRSMFPAEGTIEPGMQFNAQGPEEQMITISVVSVDDEHVMIDANHPLAGVELNFDVEVLDVRDATSEEVEHGHIHGPGGHQH